jgi:cell division protein FtsN
MTDLDEEERIGAYAPPTDGYSTFDAREEDSRRGPMLLITAIAVFILFLGVVWSAYNQGLRESGREGAPRLVPNEEPYRERPADPGGEETPGTELQVYNRLTGEGAGRDEQVSLRPAPEEPIEDSRPGLRVETVDADEAAAGNQPATEPATPDVTPRQAPERPAPERPTPQPETRQPDPEPQVQAPVREPDPVPTPAPRASAPAVAPSGDWVVQIAAFRSEADAEAAWVAFRTRFGDIASGVAPDVVQVEIPNRGTYHRLRIAAFATRDDAVSFCSTLQSRGQDCLVARR